MRDLGKGKFIKDTKIIKNIKVININTKKRSTVMDNRVQRETLIKIDFKFGSID